MAETSSVRITCTAPVNIAIIKYWGKRDEELILPLNSSLSISLHQDQLKSTTTAVASPAFSEDKLWLNGQEKSVQESRLQALLHEVRRRAAKRPLEDVQREEEVVESVNSEHRLAPPSWHVHISSKNNFPTGAGLASSASGYACLAFTLAQLFGVRGELSGIARRGSGSACRSMYGGVVRWTHGEQADGADSIAVQVIPESYWPELRVFILVVSDLQKAVSSSEGMRRSVATSRLLQHRATVLVPELLRKAEAAVKAHDFPAFSQLAMCDSNQLHAICLDTHPPIFYLNDTSRQIMRLVHAYNQACAEIRQILQYSSCEHHISRDMLHSHSRDSTFDVLFLLSQQWWRPSISDMRSGPSLWTHLELLIQSVILPCSPNYLLMECKANSNPGLLTSFIHSHRQRGS
uniref:Diphosphomevalonate decarboxylase n=1 Tax=Eptatretus burgeri TaxID=7764 RepID=A0A8C4WVV8_EPTBU